MSRDTAGQLLADWAWANDHDDMALLGSILATEATLTVVIAGKIVAGPIEGRDAIVEFVGGAVGGDGPQRRHVASNVRHGVGGFTAYLTIFDTQESGTAAVSTGVYKGELVGDVLASLTIELDRPY